MAAIATDIESLLKWIVRKLREQYHPERIVLFGSWAWGGGDAESDVDLLIVKRTAERFIDRCCRVRRILSDPGRTAPLDILVLTPEELEQMLAAGDQFIAGVLDGGKVLHAT